MAILTREQLSNFNRKMLGLGAPVQIDGQGYNKIDYGNMSDFAQKDVNKLSDRQIWFMAITLGKYKNTQLTQYKIDLEETISHYSEVSKPVVTVVDSNDKVIRLNWKFNEKVSDALKGKLDKKMYSWNKVNGQWVLNVVWDYLPTIIEEFEKNGLNCAQLKQAQKRFIQKQTAQPIPQSTKPTTQAIPPKQSVKLSVKRGTGVDTLEISSQYSPELVDAFHNIPNAIWNAKKQFWTIPITAAKTLYDTAPNTVDKTELKSWADLIAGWNSSYTLVDLNKYNLKFTPYTFQPQDAQTLLSLKTGLNANEVGCGKTFEMVLVGESIPMKKLVIVPATLRLNWEREIKMVNPNANVHTQYSDQPFKVVEGWNIISYNSLPKFQEQLEQTMFQVVMADEAHYVQAITAIGTPDSKRAKAVLRIAATAEYVFPITGTPKSSRNKNLYNILKMIRHPLTSGLRAFSEFGKKYCGAHRTMWGWDFNGNTNDEDLSQRLQPVMVRHLKRDVLPNLKKQRQAIPVKVDLREYHNLIDEYMRKRKNPDGEQLALLNRAKQVIAIQKAKHSIDFSKEVIEGGKKVVIVTGYTEVVKKVEIAFKDTCVKLVGGMTDTQKQAVIDKFQTDPSTAVIVVNINAGGVGVTLTAASTMIMNDIPWTTGQILQAEGRIWRSGQVDTAMIYFMMATDCPMDEKLINTIVDKSQTINTVIDGGLGEEIDLRKLIEKVL